MPIHIRRCKWACPYCGWLGDVEYVEGLTADELRQLIHADHLTKSNNVELCRTPGVEKIRTDTRIETFSEKDFAIPDFSEETEKH